MIKDNIELNTVVDTLEVDILKDDVSNQDLISSDDALYIKSIANVRADNNYYRLKLSPKHMITYDNTNSSKNVSNAIKDIFDALCVNVSNIESNRVDISIDSSLNYTDYFKLHLYLFELITFTESSKKKIICTSLDSFKENNIYYAGRDLKLSIYNKAHESDNTHSYQTRIEFRWCRSVSLDTTASAIKVLSKLDNIESNNDKLTAKMITVLSEKYREEKDALIINNFSEFVRKYDKYFYTAEILKGVHSSSELKGKFSNWFRDFKKSYTSFSYYSLKDIQKYRNLMNKSIKSYIKS